ncbi:hypothetical protein AB0P40_15795, partial [Streptomyces sp. NPDC079189]
MADAHAHRSPAVAAVMQGSRPRTVAPEKLPGTIARYLKAHHGHDTATAVTGDATVIDGGTRASGSRAPWSRSHSERGGGGAGRG